VTVIALTAAHFELAEIALREIEAEYEIARALAIAGRAIADPTPATCGYCGKYMRPALRTTFDGHSACAVTPQFMAALYRLTRPHATLTIKLVGERLGVSNWIVRRWYEWAEIQSIRASSRVARSGPSEPSAGNRRKA
jgi:hypothetical protein